MGKRLSIAGLAGLLLVTGLVPGGTSVAQAVTVADWVQTEDASVWSPNAPGLSGVAYREDTNTLIVVDSDKNNETDWAANGSINLWEYDLSNGQIVYSGSLLPPTDEPTGVSYDPGNHILFVSDDNPSGIHLIQPGGDGRFDGDTEFGFIDTAAFLPPNPDTEDPAFDESTGHLFFINGAFSTIWEIDPGLDGDFDTNDDIVVDADGFPIPPDTAAPMVPPPSDWEGLAIDPATGNLLVGSKVTSEIWVVTKTGVFVDVIDVSAAEPHGLFEISGLGVQPAAGMTPKTYWIADRGDTSPVTTNDGKLHRIYPGTLPVTPPVAPELGAITTPINVNEGAAAAFDANATDGNLGEALTYSISGAPVPGTIPASAINATTGVFTWTPTEAQGPGTYNMTVTVKDDSGTPPATSEDTQAVQIIVAEVNQAPVATSSPNLLHAEGESASVSMFATDADLPAQTKTWSATGLPSGLSINASSGLITGTIGIGTAAGSPYNVTVTVRDNGTPQLQDQVNFTWSITNTNRSPILGSIGNKTVAQGSPLAFTATATDPDGDGLTFSLVGAPAGATISSGGSFNWTPNVTPGVYGVTVRVTDNGTPVLTDEQTLTVTVLAVDQDPFIDDDGHIFENAIEWLASEGITQGCNPPVNNRFCPNDYVTRGQMAAFLVRAKGYTAIGDNFFIDDNGSVFETAINRLRTARVTLGCNPPVNNRYCPDSFVTRGQMAAFLVRAFGYTDAGGGDWFTDDDNSIFENAIDRLATAGVTQGCNPPVNNRYCPDSLVTRGQMAAFLKRALGG